MTRRPNLLLIIMDANRYDYLSSYGYPRPTTPNLDRLAGDGVFFERAFASAPWTPPSHASMFTGTYPTRHGVDVNENLYLAPTLPTLGDILSAQGYRTFGVLPDPHLSSGRGFHRGFQDYVELWKIPYLYPEWDWLECLGRNVLFGRDKKTLYTNRVIQRWLRKSAGGRDPFYVFVNYKTVHNRYQPPFAYRRRFGVSPRPGVDMKKVKYYSRNGGYSYMGNKFDVSEDEFAILTSWYAGAVAYLDHRIGQMIDHLKATGEYENTLIIVTADHGEHFGEHHLAYHLFSLYEPLLRVPLIMSWPAGLPRGHRVSSMVSLTDLLPTVLDLFGMEPAGEHVQGTSLVPFDGRTYHDHIFGEFGRPHYMLKRLPVRFPNHDFSHLDRGLRCIRTDRYKLILGSDGTEELYDLEKDPGERRNIAAAQPEIAGDLRATLADWVRSMEATDDGRTAEAQEEDESMKKALRALGYF
jgi:arylsulfatase A-like enzyme